MGDHYTESMYITKGNEVKLTYLGPLPARVTDKTNWQCKVCGKKHFKTYRALCLRPNGCRCWSNTTLGKEKYEKAAEDAGIRFAPNKGLLPPNTKTKTQWIGPSGKVVNATYHEIAYKMSKRTEQLLGLTPTPPEVPRKRKGRKPSELRGLPPQPKGRVPKERTDELVAAINELAQSMVSPRFA
jgi:hypothetical protein